MPTGTDWYSKMSEAVRRREIALNGLSRWEKKVAEAEKRIEELSAERDTPETLPAQQDLDTEAAALASDLRPVFGAVSAPVAD